VGISGGREGFSFYRCITNTWFLYCVSLSVFFLVWDRVAAWRIFGDSLAQPLVVLDKLYELTQIRFAGTNLGGHIWASTRRVLIGFSLASAIAVPLGLCMALNRYTNAVVKPVFDLFKPMPPIAWVSISILWFGVGEFSKIFIIAIGTFVPCLLNSYNGVRLVEPELYDVIRVLGGKRKDEIIEVCFPASFPAIFAGLQISLSVAWTCLLAAELMNARDGMGFLIKRGMDTYQPALVLGGMILIALMAWLSSLAITLIERRLCPWKTGIENL
jgi:sulfonate transport system permease protein